jgi:glycosyltransferase involved in cell wall biosynthesis
MAAAVSPLAACRVKRADLDWSNEVGPSCAILLLPMRASIVIPAHNEGANLLKTVRSCIETTKGLDCEVLIADDASSDGSIEETLDRYPRVRLVAHRRRKGCSATKDFGARESRGDVILFIDGHCKPERGAIERLVRDVEAYDGEAVVIPRVVALDTTKWTNNRKLVGQCFQFALRDFHCSWVGLRGMWMRGRFYESPSLVGCCLATSRWLYDAAWGFDRHMREWGLEDLDFSLKAWLLGYAVLHEPRASIGHRFRATFDNYSVDDESVLLNKLRMARKNFTEPVWREWLKLRRSSAPRKVWRSAWELFRKGRKSVERERNYLLANRVHDEFWYARRFGLDWPRPASIERRQGTRARKGAR